jgi:hypothetical protein
VSVLLDKRADRRRRDAVPVGSPTAQREESTVDFADPACVHLAWLSALDFLRLNAPRTWTYLLDNGGR